MTKNIENYGDNFQQESKYRRNELPQHYLDWEHKPNTYKTYPEAIKLIKLPQPQFDNKTNFWEVLKNRRSIRNFKNDALSLMDLSLLLFGMMGITRKFPRFAFRTTPSAGGLFPIETYAVINNVLDIDQGVYHYNVQDHALESIKLGDYRKESMSGCLDQIMVYNSAITFIWTAIIRRSKWKYLQRCYRYIYMDAGHIGQNFYLTAEALGLAACTIGAIYDDELNHLLDLDGIEETAVYVGITGKKINRNKN
jgi:SagB-type dehydrogenase family enzyme